VKRRFATLVAVYGAYVLALSIGRGRTAAKRQIAPPCLGAGQWPFVSIIVPAWRDRDALEACLESLACIDYPDYEVIVVAGGADGTYECASAMALGRDRMKVIEQLPRGKNAALNQGVAAASAEVLVFLDADSRLSPGWLKELVGALQDGVAASTGNYLPMHETPVSLWGDLAKVYEYQVRDRVILQGSGGIAVRREALDAIGPFPEERVSSDWDLDARLALRGYRKVFAPGALIRSHRPATLTEWWQNELRWRRLHLRSLFRLKDGLMTNPIGTLRHLFPYIAAWAVAASTAAATGALVSRSGSFAQAALVGWGALVASLLSRDMRPVVSVIAFRPSSRWLPLVPLAPLMSLMTWAACCVASLTRNQAALQFKGARPKLPRDPG
jgi:cellulose synthase/poly-beta-1,6-N-acetylglucosamine synthase-like glycosyltransferase